MSDQTPPRRPSSFDRARRVEQCQIDHLDPNPWQSRSEIRAEDLADLMASIRDFGFIGYLEARHNPRSPEGKLQLVFGHRRVAALKLLGQTTVPIVIIERPDEAMMAVGFTENYTQQSLPPVDEGMFFHRLQIEEGYTIRGLESLLGLTKGYIQNRLDLVKLPEDSPILAAYRRQSIDMTTAHLLRVITRDMADEAIAELVADVEAGAVTKVELQQMKRGDREQFDVGLPVADSAPLATTPPAAAAPAATTEASVSEANTATERPNRFTDIVLGTTPSVNTDSPKTAPALTEDEILIEAGLLHEDGTEVAMQSATAQATYLMLHAMKQFIATAQQHLAQTDLATLSPVARDDWDSIIAQLMTLVDELQAKE